MTTYTPETLRNSTNTSADMLALERTIHAHADAWQARERRIALLERDLKTAKANWEAACNDLTIQQARETELVEALKWCANHLKMIAERDYPNTTPEARMLTSERAARAAIKGTGPQKPRPVPYDDSQDFPMPDISDGDPMNDPSVR